MRNSLLKNSEVVMRNHIAKNIAMQFAELSEVESVALGGSLATGLANMNSDIDLYVYTSQDIPLEARAKLIELRSSQRELNASFWETEDYWLEKETNIKVEVIYRNDWVLHSLQDMLIHNYAQMGFSTSLWHNIVTSKVLFDRNGWFDSLKTMANIAYPQALADSIIHKNFALLRGSLAEYPKQLALAVKRNDIVQVISLIGQILNAYFDVLFALNRTLHPGAKRQLDYAKELTYIPEGMSEDVIALMTNNLVVISDKTKQIIDRLERLLQKQGVL
jgi:predicted nucleotidyltransferase